MKRFLVLGALLAGLGAFAQFDLSRPEFLAQLQSSAGASGPFTNTTIAGLLFWLQADQIKGTDTNAAGWTTNWPDSSGNGRYFWSTAAQQDTHITKADVLGGKPVVRFNGSVSAFYNSTTGPLQTNQTNFTLYFAVCPAGTVAKGVLLANQGGGTNIARFNLMTTGVKYSYDVPGASVNPNALTYMSNQVLTFVLNQAGTSAIYTNGIAATNNAFFISPFWTNTSLGVNESASSLFVNAWMGDVLAYQGAHNDGQRSIVEHYLATKYSIIIP